MKIKLKYVNVVRLFIINIISFTPNSYKKLSVVFKSSYTKIHKMSTGSLNS